MWWSGSYHKTNQPTLIKHLPCARYHASYWGEGGDAGNHPSSTAFPMHLENQDLKHKRILSSAVPSTALNGQIMINIPGVERRTRLLGCEVLKGTVQRLKSI